MKEKKQKFNYGAIGAVVLSVVIGLVAILGVASAFNGGLNFNIENAVFNISSGVEAITDKLSGSTSDNWDVGGNLTVAGSSSLTGTLDINDLDTIVSSGTFADATNTLACITNPFAATSTIDLAEALITGYSTTTFAMNVGTSTVNVGLTTTTVGTSLSIMTIPTITGTSTGVAINNINYGVAGTYAAGSIARMSVGPSEYVCFVAGDGATGSTVGVTNASNNFAGSYKVRWLR